VVTTRGDATVVARDHVFHKVNAGGDAKVVAVRDIGGMGFKMEAGGNAYVICFGSMSSEVDATGWAVVSAGVDVTKKVEADLDATVLARTGENPGRGDLDRRGRGSHSRQVPQKMGLRAKYTSSGWNFIRESHFSP
jgi:hypothetical protein